MIDMRRNTITSNAYKMAKRTRIILQYENLKAWHKILGTRSYRLNASNSAIFYLLKVNNRNTRKRCGILFKVNYKNIRRRFGVFTVKLEHISHHF